jgi:CheY-like chemotaxis protein
VYFPVAAEAPAEAVALAPAEAEDGVTGTILLVEDEEEVRAILQTSLVRRGHTVLEAGGAAEALEISANYKGKIDVLMTDVVMSGMSGRELADRLVPTRRGIKVLYVSGYNEDTVLQKGVIEGQMEFLQKPFSTKVLAKKICQMLLHQST